MNYLQYHEEHTEKAFIGVPTRPSLPPSDTISINDFHHGVFTQTPTPLQSQHQSPEVSGQGQVDLATASAGSTSLPADILVSPEEEEFVTVSTAFHPTAYPQLPLPDTIFSSSDGVLFYTHSSTILGTCESAFRDFLCSPLDNPKFRDTIIPIASTSAELNIILHMLYRMSPASYSPSFETIANAVDSMPIYSITPYRHIIPGSPLYSLLLSYAPLYPLDVYALAAHHDIHPLAVMTSSHLLLYPLQTITDSQADRMGAVYLKKLMTLHVDRFNALKNALLEPPHPHPPTRDCDFSAQRKLTRAWSLVTAHLAWDASPDMSPHSIQAALDPLVIQFDCEGCQKSLQDRLRDVIVRWTCVSFYFGRFRYGCAPVSVDLLSKSRRF